MRRQAPGNRFRPLLGSSVSPARTVLLWLRELVRRVVMARSERLREEFKLGVVVLPLINICLLVTCVILGLLW